MEKIAALEDALEKKSIVGIYSVFYTVAHGDPNFSTGKFRQLLAYVKSRGINNLFQEFDGEEFEPEDKWDEDYWALIASSLIDNFCMERIEHLEQIGKKVYPVRGEENVKPLQGEVIRENTGRGPNKSATNLHDRLENHPKKIISDEQKKKVRQGHMQKIRRDLGSFLESLFRSE